MDSDFMLIKKIERCDEKAAEVFVRKYYPRILKYCMIHVRDYGHSEDITQETFMKFFHSLDKYNHYGKAINYLYVIAANACRDYYKKNKSLYCDDVDIDTLKETTSYSAEYIETKMDIESALDKLPEELKEVAILFFFQEVKQKEIAKILNINLSLVKYRIGKAKKILSKYLSEDKL